MKEKCLLIYKSGKFYNAFSDDGIIIHALLGYKYLKFKNSVGFPESSLNKVKNALEKEKIPYKIYEKNNLIESYKGINKNYAIWVKKALHNIEMEERIERLQEKIDKCSLRDLERIVEGLEDVSSK